VKTAFLLEGEGNSVIEDPMRTSYLEVYTDVGIGDLGNGIPASRDSSGSIPQVTGSNLSHKESAGETCTLT